jgi:hypothetical protein
MAYSTDNPIRKILDLGITNGAGVYAYASSHVVADIVASEFFTGVAGYGGVGVKVNDLLVNSVITASAESSAVTWHVFESLTASTGARSSRNASLATS